MTGIGCLCGGGLGDEEGKVLWHQEGSPKMTVYFSGDREMA